MAIDLYEGRTRRLSISEDNFIRLQGAQDELRARTGRFLDPYGTSSVEPEHAKLWLMGLRRLLPTLGLEPALKDACEELITLLTEAIHRHVTVTIEGE